VFSVLCGRPVVSAYSIGTPDTRPDIGRFRPTMPVDSDGSCVAKNTHFAKHRQRYNTGYFTTRCSAIAERPRCRVRYSFGQKWKTGTGRQYFTDIIGLIQPLWYNRLENLSNSVKNAK